MHFRSQASGTGVLSSLGPAAKFCHCGAGGLHQWKAVVTKELTVQNYTDTLDNSLDNSLLIPEHFPYFTLQIEKCTL